MGLHFEGSEPQAAVLQALRAHVQNLEHELEAVKLSACMREKQLMAAEQAEAALRRQAEAQLAHVKSEFETERRWREAEREQAVSKPAMADASPASSDSREDHEFDLPDFMWKCGSSEVMGFVQGIMRENAALRRWRYAGGRLRTALGSLESSPSRSPMLSARGGGTNSILDFTVEISEHDGHHAQALVSGLREHAKDPQACAQVCVALETVPFTNPKTRLAVVEHGGIQAILDVLGQHQEARGPSLLPAVEVLWNLTFEDEAVESATAAGAIQHMAALTAGEW